MGHGPFRNKKIQGQHLVKLAFQMGCCLESTQYFGIPFFISIGEEWRVQYGLAAALYMSRTKPISQSRVCFSKLLLC